MSVKSPNMKLFLVLFAFSCHCCEVMFYLQDAGETFGMLPVAEELRKKGVDVVVLVGGVAEGKGTSIRECGVEIDPKGERSTLHGADRALKVIDTYKPKVFISGVAFAWQGELYDACRERGVTSIAFWDNFSAEGTDGYFQTAHAVEKKADRLWVPSGKVAAAFEGRENLFISGQPTLEKWAEEASKVNKLELRDRLKLEGTLAVFIGGYGAEYEKVFEGFLQSLKEVDDLYVMIQPHPKFAGKAEAEILKKYPGLPVRLMNNEITTFEAVALSDVVLCHQSTVGFQAEYLKKNVIRFPITALEFQERIKKGNPEKNLEVPSNSIERCVQYTKGMIL